MSRLRTHNNRRRAKELKQGGLYTLRRCAMPGFRWGDSGEVITLDEALVYMRGEPQ